MFLRRSRGSQELGNEMVGKGFQEGKWERCERFPGGAVCKTGWREVFGEQEIKTPNAGSLLGPNVRCLKHFIYEH